MKKYLAAFVIIIFYLATACSKEKDGAYLGAPISEKEYAKAAFAKINGLWTSTLKPVLTKQAKKYTDTALAGALGGKAIVNGSYKKTQSSSSNSTSLSTIADMTINFQQYETEGLKLTGTMRFYESYSSRTACSSSGCASSTDTYSSYKTDSTVGSGVSFAPLAIQFTYNDKQYGDSILLDSDKDHSTWSVKLTNGNKVTFSFSY